MIRCAAIVLFPALCIVASASAHGGQYRGPGGAVPPLRGPSTGGPAGPSAPGSSPTTGGRATAESSSWQTWWEFNKDVYLGRRRAVDEITITGSDDFYLGTRRAGPRIDLLAPTEAVLRDEVVPALGSLLGAERNRDIQSACLVALGKIGRDGPGVELEPTFAARIARDDQEVRETAVLALGIAGRKAALPLLTALVRDDAEGRRLADRLEVGDRTRAFAAYALGVLAHRSDDGAHKQQVHDLLLPLLSDPEADDRDLRTAAVTGLGMLRADTDSATHARLAWQTVEELLAWYQRDLGRGDELVQAHAPVAIARLLGRGTSTIHQRCKEHFAAVLGAAERRSNAILQSAALALGMLAVPAELDAADQPFSRALQVYYERGHDRQTRSFCVIALGRIGGAGNRSWLLEAHVRANNATERPWTALALGLIAYASRQDDVVDKTIAQVLLEDLTEASNDDVRAALAVATGLCGDAVAVPAVLALLREHESDERPAGYLCVSLALLDDPISVPQLSDVLERSLRRPFLLQQAAVALGCLGDKDASSRLLEMMRRSDSVAALSALALAVGEIGDARSIDPLLSLLRDEELTRLARAFVAAALGGVGDKDVLRWNTPLSRDGNYAASVDTLTNGSTGVLDIL